ncbi:MAG TPA: DcaP family trimeric outer membrane transporter, partial [Stellaceae bacterium]|nr:DcaP family trimeric outer membrane transporter [Stellaceae bacterium]
AGQTLSLMFDGDALPETVDPTATIGTTNGNGARAPQLRYTYALPSGFSVAGSLENPETEGLNNKTGGFTNSTLNSGGFGGATLVPDVIVRARLDQGWGHVSAAGIYRNQDVIAVGVPRIHENAFGGQASGHLNVFGKDTLRAEVIGGAGLGSYVSDALSGFGNMGAINTNFNTGQSSTVKVFGGNIGYTHFWTMALRSTVDVGYDQFTDSKGILGEAIFDSTDRAHADALANLVWSPVPQVDLGIEYLFVQRRTNGNGSGQENRITAETVFKF